MNWEIVKYLTEKSSQNNGVMQFDNKHYDIIFCVNLVKDYLTNTYVQKFNFKRIQLLIENKCLMHVSKIDNFRYLLAE
jgi:hypothetical protein